MCIGSVGSPRTHGNHCIHHQFAHDGGRTTAVLTVLADLILEPVEELAGSTTPAAPSTSTAPATSAPEAGAEGPGGEAHDDGRGRLVHFEIIEFTAASAWLLASMAASEAIFSLHVLSNVTNTTFPFVWLDRGNQSKKVGIFFFEAAEAVRNVEAEQKNDAILVDCGPKLCG